MDRVTRVWVVVGVLALVWIAIRPHIVPGLAEATRETVSVNLERIGGRFLSGGAIPIHCVDARP